MVTEKASDFCQVLFNYIKMYPVKEIKWRPIPVHFLLQEKLKFEKKVKFHKKLFFFTSYLCKPSQKSFRLFSKWYYVKNQWHSNDIHQFQCIYSQRIWKNYIIMEIFVTNDFFWPLTSVNHPINQFNFFLSSIVWKIMETAMLHTSSNAFFSS